jgi:hypothetical protein
MKLILENWKRFINEQSKTGQDMQLHTFHNPNAHDFVTYEDGDLQYRAGTDVKNHKDRNEPDGVIWTSTAIPSDKGTYTSEWDKHNLDMGGGKKYFKEREGAILLKPVSAKILHIDGSNYEELLKKYGEGSKKDFLNWEGIAKDYDAVHFDGNIPPYINTVDIESTAIFNPDAYEPVVLGTLEGLIKKIQDGLSSLNRDDRYNAKSDFEGILEDLFGWDSMEGTWDSRNKYVEPPYPIKSGDLTVDIMKKHFYYDDGTSYPNPTRGYVYSPYFRRG